MFYSACVSTYIDTAYSIVVLKVIVLAGRALNAKTDMPADSAAAVPESQKRSGHRLLVGAGVAMTTGGTTASGSVAQVL